MAKMGRPRKEINWEDFDKLCAIQCTEVEIASWFSCSVDTIERAVKRAHKKTFAEYYEQKAASGKISLRRQQWQLALRGDKTMLVWLGKQHLGQRDRHPEDEQPTVVHQSQVTISPTTEQLAEIIKKARS